MCQFPGPTSPGDFLQWHSSGSRTYRLCQVSVVKDDLALLDLLPLPSERCESRCALPHTVYVILGTEPGLPTL